MLRNAPRLALAGLGLALACFLAGLSPKLLRALVVAQRSTAPAWLDTWSEFGARTGVFWLGGALAAIVVARVLARGWRVPAQVGVDARCLYIVAQGSEQRVPRYQIEDAAVRARAREIDLLTSSGATIRLTVARPDDAREIAAALDLGNERAASDPSRRSSWLARRGRALAHWRASVVAGLRPIGTHRGPAHAPDEAMRVLVDARSPAERRIGAALALVGSEQRGAGERVRAAANACDDADLRAALSKLAASAADGLDEATIEAAIAGVPSGARAGQAS
ncbi:MAG: hypothetical protein R3B70_25415 [Polyangiaceae bacterium]